GGGEVARVKLPALIEAGARVTVVAPEVRPEITASSAVVIRRRGFLARDLDGMWFVVAAAPPAVNARVAAAAAERRVFVNAVDDADRASAYSGGVLRRGGVTIAISTGGRAPALAGLLREALEAVLPEDTEAWVSLGERIRAQWKQRDIAVRDRRPLLLHALQDLYATKEAS